MASLRQRGKGRVWYALFRDPNGKLVQRCTKLTDRRKAQEVADEWEKMARPSQAHVSADHVRRVLADLHRRFLGSELPTMTVRAFCAEWLELRRPEVSPDTAVFYEHAIRLFLESLGERADEDVFKVRKHDLVSFRNAEARRVTARTANHSLKVLRMIFRQAQADGWTPENPAAEVKIVRETRAEKSPKRPFTVEELAAVLRVCDDEWRAMVIRGYYTGQRLLDIATMTAGQEDALTGQVSFWTSKTGRRVVVEMHSAYREWVLEQPGHDAADAPLHPRAAASVARRTKGRTTTLSGQFTAILAKAGLREVKTHQKAEGGPGRNGRRVLSALTFHSLRHSLVSHLQNAGVSRSVVQDIVGHESEEINVLYTKLSRKIAQEAMDSLPDIIKCIKGA